MTRHVGTTAEVLEAFAEGTVPMRTASAKVPGGCRVSVHDNADGLTLYSYRTAIAVRRADGTYAVGLRKYSATTSKLQSHLRGALHRAGYRPMLAQNAEHNSATHGGQDCPDDAPTTTIHAAVPGRWNGWGPAWHATGWENVPAEVWA